MSADNSSKKLVPLLMFLVSTLYIQCAYAQSWNDNPNSARQVAKKKGKVIATDVLDWQKDKKDIPKDWIKLDNKYFSVSYPKCFKVEGEDSESNISITSAVLFKRTTACPLFKNNIGDYNWLGISYNYLAPLKFTSDATDSNLLFVQDLRLNKTPAKMLVNVIDSNIGKPDGTLPQLRWQIYLLCEKNTMRIDVDYERGKPSLERIEKSDYTFPEDFKDIVSTFKCSEKKFK